MENIIPVAVIDLQRYPNGKASLKLERDGMQMKISVEISTEEQAKSAPVQR